MFSKLTEIRGVGEKIAEKLTAYYGSEGEAVRSLQNLEFEMLFSADIPALKLIEIAREIYARKHGFEYINLLKTQEAREIYLQILNALREHVQTEYGKLRLALFYPTNDRHELERRFRYAQKARDFYETLDAESLKNLKGILRNLKPLEKPRKTRIQGEVLVTESKKLYEELKKSELIGVFLLEAPEDLEYLKDYELVRYVQTRESSYAAQVEALPQTETLLDSKLENCMPEEILSFFIENKKQISAACEILKILSNNSAFKNLKLDVLDEETFSEVAEKLQLEKSENKFSFAAANLHTVVRECAEAANAAIVEKAEKESLSLRGREVLKILAEVGSKPHEIYEHLPKEIIAMLRSTAEEWEEECARRLRLEDERIMLSGIFSEELRYPVEVSQEKLQEIETWLRTEAKKAEFRTKRKLAILLKDKVESIRKSIASLLEIDVLLALGEFSARCEANLPKLCDTLGLGFKKGRHLLLQKKIKVQPVDYALGKSDIELHGAGNERIAVITGANSGGKTTLIETIAQLQVMSQCGLPVLAEEASLSLLDELHFYGRSGGDTSAGAFENLLKSFAGLSTVGRRRLILADEIEAVTEPGAAAKIISALLEWFAKDENSLVAMVTHLGEDIDAKVRIDGIEAEGLDENLNLVVNRNPVLNKLAKSTPELIVQKLSRTEKKHADFYVHMLKKFK